MNSEAAAARYIAFCEGMTPESFERLPEFCAPDIHFRDPFNEANDLEGYRKILRKMFEDAGQPDFMVTGRAVEGATCYLRWRFTFRRGNGNRHTIQGMSEVTFAADGRVSRHFDFWDSGAIYELVPLLRGLIRLVKRRLKAPEKRNS